MAIRLQGGGLPDEMVLVHHSHQCPDELNRGALTAPEESDEKKLPDTAAFEEVFGTDGHASNWQLGILSDAGTHYMRGTIFADTARILAERMTSESGNEWGYAAVFSLRHAVEVLLKDAIQRDRDLAGLSPEGRLKVWKTHNLKALADEAVSVIRRFGQEADWEPMRAFLRKWEAADPDGSFFRYSRTRAGCVIHVNHNVQVQDILEVGFQVVEFLDGLHQALDAGEAAM